MIRTLKAGLVAAILQTYSFVVLITGVRIILDTSTEAELTSIFVSGYIHPVHN